MPVSPARAVDNGSAAGVVAANRRVGRLQGLQGVEQRVVAGELGLADGDGGGDLA